jgi:hypothetical protein
MSASIGRNVIPEDPPRGRHPDVSDQSFSAREVRGLVFIGEAFVGVDYWDDKTIKRYRAAGLVRLIDNQIMLTEAGRQLLLAIAELSNIGQRRTPLEHD